MWRLSSSSNAFNSRQVVERLRHALDVRPVGAEDHPVGAHELDDLVDVVLPERVDPDVALERLDRVFVEEPGILSRRRAQLAEQVGEELGAVLDRRDAEVREPAEEVVEDERREEVVDRPLDRAS